MHKLCSSCGKSVERETHGNCERTQLRGKRKREAKKERKRNFSWERDFHTSRVGTLTWFSVSTELFLIFSFWPLSNTSDYTGFWLQFLLTLRLSLRDFLFLRYICFKFTSLLIYIHMYKQLIKVRIETKINQKYTETYFQKAIISHTRSENVILFLILYTSS